VTSYVVLLRAVNVGGRALSSERWREALATLGLPARTLGTTGNALVEAGPGVRAEHLEKLVEDALVRAGGPATEAFARNGREWDRIVRGNPFPKEAAGDPAHLLVTVLRSAPDRGAWDDLKRSIPGRESVAPGERCAYVVYPDGIGRSRLTAALLERKLGVRGTSRNWNTVLRLQDLVRQSPPDAA
jgi:uncharacterized protein (DUF1697 family)